MDDPSEGKPRRVTRRRAETRQRLLEAARAVFAEEGFGRASVEEVCERAGYTRGAFYSNFDSLDELFLAMWAQRSTALLAAIASSLEATDSERILSLEDGVDRLLELLPLDDHWYRIEAEFTAHALRVPALRAVMAAREGQIAATLLPFIDRALERVGRRVVDREAFAAALVAVHDGTAVQCLIEPEDPVVRQRRRELFLAVVGAYTLRSLAEERLKPPNFWRIGLRRPFGRKRGPRSTAECRRTCERSADEPAQQRPRTVGPPPWSYESRTGARRCRTLLDRPARRRARRRARGRLERRHRFALPAIGVPTDFVEAPDGSSTLAWFTQPAGGSEVPTAQLQHATSDGTTGAPLTLGPGAVPTLATSASNMTAVAWIGLSTTSADVTVHVTLLDAGGARVKDTVVATFESGGAIPTVDVALDAAANATVVWSEPDADSGALEAVADRVAPDGSHAGPVTLGETDESDSSGGLLATGGPAVAAAPGGTVWFGWRTPDGAVDVARRFGGDDVPATEVSAAGDEASSFRLSASAAGAAIAWMVPPADADPEDPSSLSGEIDGTRLTTTGSLGGTPFGATGAFDSSSSSGGLPGFDRSFDVATAPDGVVSLGWTSGGGVSGFGGNAVLTRFAPGQETATATPLDSRSLLSLAPALGAGPDGSLMMTWLTADSTTSFSLQGARVAPDGTIGAARPVTTSSTAGGSISIPSGMPQADGHGGGIVGVSSLSIAGGPGGFGGFAFSFTSYRFDVTGPTVTVDVPATGITLSPVLFNGTVADPAGAPLNWDFGDGSGGRGLHVSHVYAGPGTYTVTASATDDAGNETVVTRQISVANPQPADTGRTPPPPVASAAASGLKIARATRSGARVTVSGTIGKKVTGKLSIVYAQKVSGSTISVKKTAKISKGRWSATLVLPHLLTRGRAARGKGTVTVTFAGTAAVKRATVKHAVSIARARRAKKTKRRAAAHGKHKG